MCLFFSVGCQSVSWCLVLFLRFWAYLDYRTLHMHIHKVDVYCDIEMLLVEAHLYVHYRLLEHCWRNSTLRL